jgi:hypothetical protein
MSERRHRFNAASASQHGGVTLWSINKAAHRVTTSGQDTDGLGRWAWTHYRGRNNVSLRVVTAYRPVRNTTGAMSVWNQQRSYFDVKDDDRCPRELFNLHLVDAIRTWLAAGDQLVVALDANEDVRSGTVYKFLLDLGLTEAMIDQHGPDGPSTFAHGSCPIDGLFVSSTLLGLRCGVYWLLAWSQVSLDGHSSNHCVRSRYAPHSTGFCPEVKGRGSTSNVPIYDRAQGLSQQA